MNYETLVRRLRQRIFNYCDESETKGQKASRILEKAIARKIAERERAASPQEREMQRILRANTWLTAADLY